MITITNKQRKIPIDTKALMLKAQKMLDYLEYSDFDLGIWLTTNKTIRTYNRDFRHKDKATDILSFPFYPDLTPGSRIEAHSDDEKNVGDMIISLEYVLKDAPRWGHTFEERMDVLLAHGIAHLLNYDHQTEQEYAQMQQVEKKLLSALH